MSSTVRIVPQGRPQSIPPASVSVGMSPQELVEHIRQALVECLRGEWMEYKPDGVSTATWKAVQLGRQPIKLGYLAHIYGKRTPAALRAKAAVIALFESARGHDRRLGLRRLNPFGRRAADGGK